MTTSLPLASAIALYFPLKAIDKTTPNKATFIFSQSEDLQTFVEGFWRGDLKVEPLSYFNSIKVLKSRIYERLEI